MTTPELTITDLLTALPGKEDEVRQNSSPSPTASAGSARISG